MDIKNIVSIDDENIWKSDHTSNPYAIVLNAKKIWRFTKHEWPDKYKFYSVIIKENAQDFRWGLQKQKSFKVLTIKEYCYFMAPPDIIYRAIRKEDGKKNKRPIKRNR
tara:strand:- start:15 stop:338 length:324 start_codon:yes stop_codon:yes gene_type:complete